MYANGCTSTVAQTNGLSPSTVTASLLEPEQLLLAISGHLTSRFFLVAWARELSNALAEDLPASAFRFTVSRLRDSARPLWPHFAGPRSERTRSIPPDAAQPGARTRSPERTCDDYRCRTAVIRGPSADQRGIEDFVHEHTLVRRELDFVHARCGGCGEEPERMAGHAGDENASAFECAETTEMNAERNTVRRDQRRLVRFPVRDQILADDVSRRIPQSGVPYSERADSGVVENFAENPEFPGLDSAGGQYVGYDIRPGDLL
ncbi:hypothetical protein [Nocardia asiatica]|uniref:hypothetical protein n=1 Tax=Nocardia asiatica TaxID=209252 RepID=UPI0024540195|nr:hypothetical protein [Nocardia asiatica]